MGISIHARRVDGRILFRIWHTGGDTYVTDPLSEENLRDELLFRDIDRVLGAYESTINEAVAQAKARGVSSIFEEGPVSLDSPWKEKRDEGPLPAELTRERLERLKRHRALLEKILANWPDE